MNHDKNPIDNAYLCLQFTQWGLKIIINAVILIFVLYFLYLVSKDVNKHFHDDYDEKLAEIKLCKKKYEDSECEKEISQNIRKTFVTKCLEWKTCMNEKPSGGSRLNLYAIEINSFIRKIFSSFTYRSIFIIICILSGTIIILKFIS